MCELKICNNCIGDNVLDKCLGATLHCGVMLKNITLNGREDFIDFVLLCGANEYISSLNLAFSIFFLYLCALNYIVLIIPYNQIRV